MSENLSSSAVQNRAEGLILDALSRSRGWDLRQDTVLPNCPEVRPDGVDLDNRVICEVYARIGKLPPGPQRKLAKDILKLKRMNRKAGGDFTLVMAFASNQAAAYLRNSGWVADEVRHFGIEVVVIDLPQEEREKILAAQSRQVKGITAK